MAESVSVDVLAKVYGERDIAKLGDQFAKTAVTADAAAASLKVWNDTAAKGAKADTTLVAARNAHAKADKLLADAEAVLAGKATTTTRLLADQRNKLEDAGKAAGNAASGFTGLAGLGGGYGMGAAIAAGVALSPVIATVGVGVGGLALAALAAGKNSKILAAELAPLKQQFAGFQKQLQPTVLTDFAAGAKLAGTVLHGVEPVAAATGKALGGTFAAIDAEFKSQTWTQFFGFMRTTAGPDVALLTDNFVGLLKVLPPLIEQLQPLATTVLKDTAGILALVGAAEKAVATEHRLAAEAQHSTGWLGRLANAGGQVFKELVPGAGAARTLATDLGKLGDNSAASSKGIAAMVTPAQSAAKELQAMATAVTNLNSAESKALSAQTTYANDLLTSAGDAKALEKALDASRNKIGLHTAAQRASFGAANTYITDLGNQASAAVAAGKGEDGAIKAIRTGLPILDAAKTKNQAYWQEVKTLHDWLVKLENLKAIKETVFVSGSGTFTVRPGTKLGLPGGTAGGPFAAGGMIPGSGNRDTFPAMLTPGEVVVPKGMVGAGAVDHLRGRLPGFASGGLVPSYSGPVAGLPPWTRHDLNATVSIFEHTIAKATLAAMKAAARQAASFGGGGFPGGRGGLGTAERAWMAAGGPGGITAHIAGAIAGAESGWTMAIQKGQPYATTGWGPWQITPGNSEPQFGTDYALLNWRSNALAAVAKYRQAGGSFSPWTTYEDGAYLKFMDRGGWLAPGLNHVYNGTGRPEQVLPNRGGGQPTIVLEIAPGGEGALTSALMQVLRRQIRIRGGDVQGAFATSR